MDPGQAATQPQPGDGPSERARKNIRTVLLELLTTQDVEVLEALSKVVPVLTPACAPLDAEGLKPALLTLLATDPEVRQAVDWLAPQPKRRLGDSDAEHAANLVDLIETKMRQSLRPDAFRRPAYPG